MESKENILKQPALLKVMSVVLGKHFLMIDSFVIHDFELNFSQNFVKQRHIQNPVKHLR